MTDTVETVGPPEDANVEWETTKAIREIRDLGDRLNALGYGVGYETLLDLADELEAWIAPPLNKAEEPT